MQQGRHAAITPLPRRQLIAIFTISPPPLFAISIFADTPISRLRR